MVQNLIDYLRDNPCKGFRPVPHYSADGDFLTYHFRPEAGYEERVDDFLTVYRAFETGQIVGCKIEGVKRILDAAGAFGVETGSGPIRLGFFFFAVAAVGKTEDQARRYRELGQLTKDAAIEREQLKA
jgi:hypothetical protein